MATQNILIDTDAGDDVDDILAIAFALLRPELDVKAITTVSLCSEKRSQIIARLLQVMQRTDVPFAPGMNLPLRGLSREELQSFSDALPYKLNQYPFVKQDELASLPAAQEDAISLMARTVEQYAGNIALVAIGPLTNVAVFLRRYPHLAAKLQWIAIMGAELELNRREHNIAWDAHAADIVFTSGVPLFVGTWNVTRQFVLSPDDCERIKSLGTPLGNALGECIDLWWPHKGHKPGPVMYDIAPILWSYERRFYSTKSMAVQVETQGQSTLGMTTSNGKTPNAEVSVSMLADEVRELYLSTICG
jgi:purine nucleosidase